MWRKRSVKETAVFLVTVSSWILIIRVSYPLHKRHHTCSMSTNIKNVIRTDRSLLETAIITLKGKTQVYRYNGATLDRLHEFCSWTLPFNCTTMKIPSGQIPLFIHDIESGPIVRNGQKDSLEINSVMKELEHHQEAMFVDIGARIGKHTLTIAASLNRPVLSVEPVMENIVRLCKSVQENGLTDYVTLVFNPLSDTNELVEREKPLYHLNGSRVNLFKKSELSDVRHSCPKPLASPTAQLDDLLPLMASTTAVLKVDVGSHEYHVINGGKHFLDEIYVPAIFMAWGHVKRRPEVHRLLHIMKERGYVAHKPRADGRHSPLSNETFENWSFDVVWIKQ